MKEIPEPNSNAETISFGQRRQNSGGVSAFKWANMNKEDCAALAKQGGIHGVGIAGWNGSKYLKSTTVRHVITTFDIYECVKQCGFS